MKLVAMSFAASLVVRSWLKRKCMSLTNDPCKYNVQVYTRTPEDVNQFLAMTTSEFAATLAAQQNMKLDTLTRLKEAIADMRPTNFDDCVAWARYVL